MATTAEVMQKLIAHINRQAWWHVPPRDPRASEKRGKFYSSSFREAEFWGRPLDEPERVSISSPLVAMRTRSRRGSLGELSRRRL